MLCSPPSLKAETAVPRLLIKGFNPPTNKLIKKYKHVPKTSQNHPQIVPSSYHNHPKIIRGTVKGGIWDVAFPGNTTPIIPGLARNPPVDPLPSLPERRAPSHSFPGKRRPTTLLRPWRHVWVGGWVVNRRATPMQIHIFCLIATKNGEMLCKRTGTPTDHNEISADEKVMTKLWKCYETTMTHCHPPGHKMIEISNTND